MSRTDHYQSLNVGVGAALGVAVRLVLGGVALLLVAALHGALGLVGRRKLDEAVAHREGGARLLRVLLAPDFRFLAVYKVMWR